MNESIHSIEEAKKLAEQEDLLSSSVSRFNNGIVAALKSRAPLFQLLLPRHRPTAERIAQLVKTAGWTASLSSYDGILQLTVILPQETIIW